MGVEKAPETGQEMAELLDRIPGAWDRIEQGIEDANEGRVVPNDELSE
jgi:predicted transcriptional regulator